MASFFNPISALSMYGASPYARPSSGGYQSSLSLPTEASPYGNDIYGVDPYAAEQDPISALMSLLSPPPPPPPPKANENEIVMMVLKIIMMLVGQQGQNNGCQPCQKKQQRSDDYAPQLYASNPSYAPYPDSSDYASIINGSENPYADYSDESTYVPEVIDDTVMAPGNSDETELVGDSVVEGDPFAGDDSAFN